MNFIKRTVVFLILFFALFLFLSSYAVDYSVRRSYVNQTTENIDVSGGKIYLDTLTTRQKLAQMIMVRGDRQDLRFTKLNVGGIFLDKQKNQEAYTKQISIYQGNTDIRLFVATDLEGAWTPFSDPEPHQVFPPFSEIETAEEAYNVGSDQGRLLDEIGFNMNFAPVAEFSDEAYGGRVFHGTKEEIQNKISLYIQGLQTHVLSTCKHYPGQAMKKNLHFVGDQQEISQHDLDLFLTCYENNVSAIMVSHQTITGALDSGGKPSSVSPEIIGSISDDVLVIADEINMAALQDEYPDRTLLYIELINAGNDFILDFEINSLDLYKLLIELEKAVDDGRISEEKVDYSVKKILTLKGYVVE